MEVGMKGSWRTGFRDLRQPANFDNLPTRPSEIPVPLAFFSIQSGNSVPKRVQSIASNSTS